MSATDEMLSEAAMVAKVDRGTGLETLPSRKPERSKSRRHVLGGQNIYMYLSLSLSLPLTGGPQQGRVVPRNHHNNEVCGPGQQEGGSRDVLVGEKKIQKKKRSARETIGMSDLLYKGRPLCRVGQHGLWDYVCIQGGTVDYGLMSEERAGRMG